MSGSRVRTGAILQWHRTQLGGFDLGPFGQSLTDSSSFAPTSLLGVIVDITVDGGTTGGAGLVSATTQFTPTPQVTPVPEPATLTLLALGLAAVMGRPAPSKPEESAKLISA